MPRNLILRYSNPGDWVLDSFMGSGTTLVEAKLLNRNAVGVDINPQSVSISDANLQFQCDTSSKVYTCNGNAANLHFIKDNSIDLICTHPPYANIIRRQNVCCDDRGCEKTRKSHPIRVPIDGVLFASRIHKSGNYY